MRPAVAPICWLLLTLCCALPARHALAGDTSKPGRAALVNGTVITSEAFQAELRRLERQKVTVKEKTPAGALAKKQALENLILRELLFQEAGRRGLRVSPQEVDRELSWLKRQYPAEGALERILDRMGLEASLLKDQLEKGMAIQKLMELEFAAKASVSDGEVSNYYEEHPDLFRQPLRLRLSHILIKSDPGWDPEKKRAARARLEELRLRLLAGEDFGQLARDSSECFSSKKGGDLGYFLPGQLARNMEAEAGALKPGEVSGIVEDRFGLHLLKLTELRRPFVPELSGLKEKIRQDLKSEKELNGLAPFVKRLRVEAKVEILLDGDENGAE